MLTVLRGGIVIPDGLIVSDEIIVSTIVSG